MMLKHYNSFPSALAAAVTTMKIANAVRVSRAEKQVIRKGIIAMRKHSRKHHMKVRLAILMCGSLLAMGSVWAQEAPGGGGAPPPTRAVDGNGIDLMTNQYMAIVPKLSTAGIMRDGNGTRMPFRDNFTGIIYIDHSNNDIVTLDGRQQTDGTMSCDTGAGTSQTCAYTAKSGEVAIFDMTMNCDGKGRELAKDGIVTQITKPDGEVLKYYYRVADQYFPPTVIATDQRSGAATYEYHHVKQFQPISIVSSAGWMLKYDLEAVVTNNGEVTTLVPRKIYIINTSIDYCDPTAFSCTSANAGMWPTLNIANALDYSDVNGVSLGGFDKLSSTTPSGIRKVVYIWGDMVQTVTIGNNVWHYSHDWSTTNSGDPPYVTTVTDPAGHGFGASADQGHSTYWIAMGDYSATVNENFSTYQLNSFTDENGRTTKYTYVGTPSDGNGDDRKVYQVISPEATYSGTTLTGGYTQYAYDSRNNITSVSVYPKGGGAPLVTAYVYESACTTSNYKYCNRVKAVIDPKGNQTDYTYDPASGQIATETKPADAAGIRPQTRYFYTPLYAKVKNSAGALVNADAPIYKLTSTSTCASATAANPASCVGTASETVTVYAYNTNNLLMTSKTIAAGDSSVSATTAYAYDSVGNVVSVDGPRTDVDDTTYSTYDVRRRTVYEIGVDPDGSGPLRRAAVHHLYDIDSNEYRTENGTCGTVTFGNGIPTGCDFVLSSYTQRTYDATYGNLIKTITATVP